MVEVRMIDGGDEATVAFTTPAKAGNGRMAVVGSFNDWDPTATPISEAKAPGDRSDAESHSVPLWRVRPRPGGRRQRRAFSDHLRARALLLGLRSTWNLDDAAAALASQAGGSRGALRQALRGASLRVMTPPVQPCSGPPVPFALPRPTPNGPPTTRVLNRTCVRSPSIRERPWAKRRWRRSVVGEGRAVNQPPRLCGHLESGDTGCLEPGIRRVPPSTQRQGRVPSGA